jgi:hypothetical protein
MILLQRETERQVWSKKKPEAKENKEPPAAAHLHLNLQLVNLMEGIVVHLMHAAKSPQSPINN